MCDRSVTVAALMELCTLLALLLLIGSVWLFPESGLPDSITMIFNVKHTKYRETDETNG
ncbi:MAG: hypothetical protein FWH27_01870 [Planctomycetaceae bacterium]|nr:hypothetical protein [Planctomycetaceae bacterium]